MQNKILQDCVSSQHTFFSLYTELYRPCSVQWFEGWCGECGEVGGGHAELVESSQIFWLSGEIYPREPSGIRLTFMSLISVTMWEYFSVFRRFASWIFGSRGTVSSNTNICLSEIITMSGRYDVTMIWGGIVPPPARLNGVMSAYRVHFDRSILLQIQRTVQKL